MFITLEGIEGSGKTTLIRLLEQSLRQQGREVLLTREPGGSELGRQIRPLLLSVTQEICPEAELFLFLADRAQHVASVIRPALERGAIILCDRYVDSTIAYQGYGRGMDIRRLEMLNTAATGGLMPQLTLLLDLSPETGLKRACKRNKQEHKEAEEGRFEAEEAAFHRRIRHGFLARATSDPQRIHILNALLSSELLAAEALEIINTKLAQS